MMWSSDYPHHGNDWPYSRKTIEEMMGSIAEDEKARITGGNAARIWGLDALTSSSRTPSRRVALRGTASSVRRCSVRWCT